MPGKTYNFDRVTAMTDRPLFRYFGGSLDFVSLDGWGSDVYLKLRCLDDAEDVVIW